MLIRSSLIWNREVRSIRGGRWKKLKKRSAEEVHDKRRSFAARMRKERLTSKGGQLLQDEADSDAIGRLPSVERSDAESMPRVFS